MARSFKLDPDYDPHRFAFPPGSEPREADRKWPPASELYPELGEYKRLMGLERYTSREYAAREWDAMWAKVWTCAGRESDLPAAGSWFRYDVGPESVIVNRNAQGTVQAFYNVCQHRGRQLVDADCGRNERFVCPFHSWAYDLDGRNIRVTDQALFTQQALCGDLNLKPVRCETWAGFVFVNFDPDAEPLLDFLGPVVQAMASYRMEDMHVVHDVVLPIACNWKIGIEAFLEAYHAHITHPQILPFVDDVYEQSDVFPRAHSRLATRIAVPSPRVGPVTELNPGLSFMLADAGVEPARFTGSPAEVQAAIVAAKRSRDNRFGLDYSAFSDSQITDDWNYFLFPNMTFNTHPEGVLIMRFLPDADDPTRFVYHVTVIVPKLKEGCKAPFYMGVPDEADISGRTRPARIRARMEDPQVGEVLTQDISNMEAAQRGLRSRGLPGGMRYAEREMRLQVMHAEIDRYLQRAGLNRAHETPEAG